MTLTDRLRALQQKANVAEALSKWLDQGAKVKPKNYRRRPEKFVPKLKNR